mmetsp:Transcript_13555/g.29471  ORF Transcript_13555/g.29471 Transcript_13555/m.29471 type:complete len:226 (-) Transcript_13555:276-953(-)|eukprot:CAMPEP_0172314688 /NCGR_PEP_ID=MMETSP1058-20130122/23134_1 /TAXON_ID=83371 /ORGANISM="Detonula confervacea, Strain CCMP 353" /LENGTH=225 /DNA_ID=CAMNT_0013028619 /DNA_START=58 /DNA_END=735 /DNA_ORIENTATION=-
MATIAFFLCLLASISAAALAFSTQSTQPLAYCNRRQALLGIVTTTSCTVLTPPSPALARAPGSTDVSEAISQIQDASQSLRTLLNDWALYSVIDAEGRAGSTDGARRILGGIAPQAGSAAIEAAKNTPLYRIDVAFVTVRKAVLEGDEAWADNLDLDKFEDLAEKIVYGVQKADGNFYGVLFAQKGTSMIEAIFTETKMLVKEGIDDLDEIVGLLKDAGASGVII